MIPKPKGTYDVLPGESSEWEKLEDTIRKICKTLQCTPDDIMEFTDC